MNPDTQNPVTEGLAPVTYIFPKLNTIHTIGGIFCSVCRQVYKDKAEYDLHYKKEHPDESKFYTCIVCYKTIKMYPKFRDHCYSMHTAKHRFKCEICTKTFSKPSHLKEHQRAVHTEKFICTHKGDCKQSFTTKQELLTHMKTHTKPRQEPPFPCVTCNQTITTMDCCETHVEDHATFIYSCPMCSEELNDRPTARQHLVQHFGQEDIENINIETEYSDDSSIDLIGGILCHVCDTAHKDHLSFDLHFKTNHPNEEIGYSCNVCLRKFEKYHQLGNHCYDHSVKHKFVCDKCDKRFSRLSLLVAHSVVCATNLDDPSRPFQCARCPVKFADERRLHSHMRETHDEHHFTCHQPQCGMTFQKPKDLYYHQMSHKNTNNWCRQCGLDFISLAACEKHLSIHMKKNYKCPVCAKSYDEKYLLMKHLTNHFQGLLHICKICGKVYKARNRLAEHLKVHSETKTLECSYCGKGFTKLYHYKEHLNIHTGAQPYKCTACPKKFSNYPNWSKHLQKIHNIHPKDLKKDAKKATDNNNVTETGTDLNEIENIDIGELVKFASDYVKHAHQMDEDVWSKELDNTGLDSIEPTVLGDMGDEYENQLPDAVAGVEAGTNFVEIAPFTSDTSSQEPFTESIEPLQPLQTIQPAQYTEIGPDYIYEPQLSTVYTAGQTATQYDPYYTIEQPIITEHDALSYNYQQYGPDYDAKREPPILTKLYNYDSNVLTDIY